VEKKNNEEGKGAEVKRERRGKWWKWSGYSDNAERLDMNWPRDCTFIWVSCTQHNSMRMCYCNNFLYRYSLQGGFKKLVAYEFSLNIIETRQCGYNYTVFDNFEF